MANASELSLSIAADGSPVRPAQMWLTKLRDPCPPKVTTPQEHAAPPPVVNLDITPATSPGRAAVRLHSTALQRRLVGDGRRPSGGEIGVGFAGIVEAVTSEVDALQPGDRVFGTLSSQDLQEGQECLVLNADALWRIPAALDFVQASALPAIGLTAWQMLLCTGRPDMGEPVVVLGAETPVGMVATQLAAVLGLPTAAATRSPGPPEHWPAGLSRTFSAAASRLEYECGRAALVLDALGGPVQRRAMSALTPGSMLVSCVHYPTQSSPLPPKRTAVRFVSGVFRAQQLDRLIDLVSQGLIRLPPPTAIADFHETGLTAPAQVVGA